MQKKAAVDATPDVAEHVFNNGVNITKSNAFFFTSEFKLPANALFGEKVDQRRCRVFGCGVLVESALSKSRPGEVGAPTGAGAPAVAQE